MIKNATPETIAEAANLIKSGELVAFPTETVYGLGANATNIEAVAKIYALKNRPTFNPLIIHVSDLEMAEKIAVFNDRARIVAENFWPGAITLILSRCKNCPFYIPDITTAGLDTVALRIPSYRIAQEFIKNSGVPIAAPSANRSGATSSTSAFHVADSFGEEAPFILAGGRSDIGLESTILDLSTDKPTILRPGAITIDDLAPIIGTIHLGGSGKVKSPGQLQKHYATQTPLRLNAVDVKKDEALLAFGNIHFMAHEEFGSANDMPSNFLKNLSPEGDLHEAANHLFSYMRDLDKVGAKVIAVMNIPETGIGLAINDRLQRAATDDRE